MSWLTWFSKRPLPNAAGRRSPTPRTACLSGDATISALRATVPAERRRSVSPGLLARHGIAPAELEGTSARPALQTGLSLQRCGKSSNETGPAGVVYGSAPSTTTEVFAPGDVPGENPQSNLTAGGVEEITFDGDGDQMKELRGRFSEKSQWPSGNARTIHVEITMIASGVSRGADFDVPDTPGGSGPKVVLFREVTDGFRPARISLVSPIDTEVLLFYPPVRTNSSITYRAELSTQPYPGNNPPVPAGQSHEFSFPPGGTPLRQVFQAAPPTVIGGIQSVDITVGAYNDRFRLTFQKPNPATDSTVMGISVISTDDSVVAGQPTDISVAGGLNLQVISTASPSLQLDLNGDGVTDLSFFDRLSSPNESERWGPPVKDRHLNILATGPALPGGAAFDYYVRDGLIDAGSASPQASDQAAASNARAVTGLQQQQIMGVPGITGPADMGTLRGELDTLDVLLLGARQKAREANVIGEPVFKAWGAADIDFIRLTSQMADPTTPVDADLKKRLAEEVIAFYDALALETQSATERSYSKEPTITNKYLGLKNDFGIGPSAGDKVAADILAGNLADGIRGYGTIVQGLDWWIADKYREKYGKPDPNHPETNQGNQIDYLTNLRHALGEVEGKGYVRVAAVFHPDEPYFQTGQISEMPLSLYYVREGDSWYLYDFTNASEVWHTKSEPAGPETKPPAALFDRLDEGDHFPKGIVHYQVTDGVGGQTRTTGPGTWRKVLMWIGIGAAALGLGLVTFGTGTVAVIGTAALAVSAAAGGALATVDLVERAQHGTLTLGIAVLDIAQIIAAVAGIGALGAGRIISVARTAAADGAPLTGPVWELLAGCANKAVIPLAATNIASDTLQVAIIGVEAAKQLDAIDQSPGTAESRRRAKYLLLLNLGVTLGMTALSLKGNVAEITMGRRLSIIEVNGQPVVVPEGQSAVGTQLLKSRKAIEAAADPAATAAAEAQYLAEIKARMPGPGGEALAEAERMAQASKAGPAATVDAAGAVTGPGQPPRNMNDLTRSIADANNAARAHGTEIEYVLEIRPGSTPNTSDVRVVARKALPGAPIDISGRRYKDVAARAEAQARQVDILLARDRGLRAAHPGYPGSNLEVTPEGLIRINGQIEIHPDRLAQLKPADQDDLLRATQELAAKGGKFGDLSEGSRKALDRLAASPGAPSDSKYRLRFVHSRARAEAFLRSRLAEQGLDPDKHALFKKPTDADWNRAYDLTTESLPTKAPNLSKQATSYALQAAKDKESITEFVEHYQFYLAEFMSRARTTQATAGATTPSAKGAIYASTEAALGESGNPAMASAATVADFAAEYKKIAENVNGRFNKGAITPGLSDADAVDAIRAMGDVTFSTESAAVYHTKKHAHDVPGYSARKASDAQFYLDSAVETIKTGDRAEAIASRAAAQNGSGRSYSFAAPGGKPRALVFVTNEGKVMLLTYQ
jgi:hypothetical protein